MTDTLGKGRLTDAYDRLGRQLTIGDLCVCEYPRLLSWELVEVTPVVDPRAPAGLVELRFVTSLRMPAQARQPIAAILITETRVEREERKLATASPRGETPS